VILGEMLELHYGANVVKLHVDERMPTMVWVGIEAESEAQLNLPPVLARRLATAILEAVDLASANEKMLTA
jgi:hypothetical protein